MAQPIKRLKLRNTLGNNLRPREAPLALAKPRTEHLAEFALDYPSAVIGRARIVQADCFEWLRRIPDSSLHAIVTDPPYGVKEYEFDQLEKRAIGRGGIWRLPPDFDGSQRAPLPRFTALNEQERETLKQFFFDWAKLVNQKLRPGGHVLIASNAFICLLVFAALAAGGLEFRGQIIRLVRTLRGGDRPKNAEREFPDVSSMPRGSYEPWGIFRRPLGPGMKVSDCLRQFETGGLRRRPDGNPFSDLIPCMRTPQQERAIANHPSLKPQSLLRQLTWAALPLGRGVIADPFMGSGSTLAAANAVGLDAIGTERHPEYYELARKVIPKLAALEFQGESQQLLFERNEAVD